MKIVCLVMTFVTLLTGQALAISPINYDLIQEASNYGETHAQMDWAGFAAPWSVFEEKADKLDNTEEFAVLYTPFLLIAADMKEKTLSNQTMNPVDAEKLLADYKGFLVFSVKLLGNDKNFAQNSVAVLKQNNKIVKFHQAVIPSESETKWSPVERSFSSQCYFYFLENEIDLDKPVILTITKRDKQKSNFYFNLRNIK